MSLKTKDDNVMNLKNQTTILLQKHKENKLFVESDLF